MLLDGQELLLGSVTSCWIHSATGRRRAICCLMTWSWTNVLACVSINSNLPGFRRLYNWIYNQALACDVHENNQAWVYGVHENNQAWVYSVHENNQAWVNCKVFKKIARLECTGFKKITRLEYTLFKKTIRLE